MQIDHIALYTRDLERLCEFYTKYFDGTAGKLYQNEETGTQACFVSFADGARLEIVTRPQFEDAEHSRLWTGWAHTSFKAGTRENVDALTEQMRSRMALLSARMAATAVSCSTRTAIPSAS